VATQLIAGFLYTDAGAAIAGATAELYTVPGGAATGTTSVTDANGYWSFSHATEGRFDVKITNGSSIRWRKNLNSEQITSLEVQTLRIRNPAFTFDYDIVPAAIAADRILNLPLITTTDTLGALGLAQTWTAVQTFVAPVLGAASATSIAVPALSSTAAITLTPTTDTLLANGTGLVVGHASQITVDSNLAEFQVLGTASADSIALLGRWSADTSAPAYNFLKSRNAAIGSFTIVQNADGLGVIRWYADDGADYDTEAASIAAYVDGTPGANDMPTRLVFSTTADGSNSATERVRIDRLGNVGIGMTAFGTSAAGVLGLFNGTVPSTSPADTVQLFAVDIAAGRSSLGIRTEDAVIATAAADSTHKLVVTINGTQYAIMLTTVLT
jgi:hypothetical protein